MRSLLMMLVLLGAVVMAVPAQAVLVSNGGTTLFFDDLEDCTDPSPYSWQQQQQDLVPRSDSDPDNANVGTWAAFDRSNMWDVQATTARDNGYDPNPYQGDGYLRVVRPGGGSWVFADFASQSSGVLHVEFMLAVGGVEALVNHGTHIRLSDGHQEEGWPSRICLGTLADGSIVNYAGGWASTGLTYTPMTWQKWEIDYAIGTGAFVLTIDGASAVLATASDGPTSTLTFRGGATGGITYVDAVPEPLTMSLLGIGGLLAVRRRK